jgi:hypothetical protein
MLSENAITTGGILLLVLLGLVLIPAYEHFKDGQGRETDAPPKPDWLKPINPRTGVREKFPHGDYYIQQQDNTVGDYKPENPLPAEQNFSSDESYIGKYLPSWIKPTEAFVDEKIPSKVELIPPVSVPKVDLSSTLGTTPGAVVDAMSSSRPEPSTNLTVPRPDFSYGTHNMAGEVDNDYLKKSSLVPCIKTRESGGAKRRSVIPGTMPGDEKQTSTVDALSRAQDQFNVMKPFNMAFTSVTDEPQGFLNSFSAFTR